VWAAGMICKTSLDRVATATLAAAFGVVVAFPAFGQSVWPAQKPPVEAATDAADTDETQEKAEANAADDIMKDVDVSKLDWSQLNVDASDLAERPAAKTRGAKPSQGGSELTWSNNRKANGGSDVSVKQQVAPFWDTRVGADMTVAHEPTTMSELLADTANGGNPRQSSGTAWAAVTAPGAGPIWDKTSLEARVDPSQDQSKLGTTISKQVPITDQTSLTLENGANVIQQGVVTGAGINARPSRNYDTEQSAKVSNSDTGTSLTAGQTLSTSDDKWLRKVGAEQKVFGGVTVSGSVGETPQGTTSKSISAGYKSNW
jgi:hypothetical protein